MVNWMCAISDKDGNDVIVRTNPSGIIQIGTAQLTSEAAKRLAQIVMDATRPQQDQATEEKEDWRANQQRRVERLEGRIDRLDKLLSALNTVAEQRFGSNTPTTGAGRPAEDDPRMSDEARTYMNYKARSINDLANAGDPINPFRSGGAVNMLEERGPMQMPSAAKRGYEGADEVGGLAGASMVGGVRAE